MRLSGESFKLETCLRYKKSKKCSQKMTYLKKLVIQYTHLNQIMEGLLDILKNQSLFVIKINLYMLFLVIIQET